MKKLFNHTKRSAEKWYEREEREECYAEEEYESEEYYGEEEYEPQEGEYYAEEEYEPQEGEYYGEEEYEPQEGEYYAEEEYESEEYYGEEEYEPQEGEYYAEEEYESQEYYGEEEYEPQEGEYYAEEEYESQEYYGEEEYEPQEEYYAEEEYEAYSGGKVRNRTGEKYRKSGFLEKLHQMDVMDRIMAAAGVGILVLALVAGGMYVSTRQAEEQMRDFVNVGMQLNGINLIGEKGLMAVADAQLARKEAAEVVEDEEKPPQYNENDYKNIINVNLDMVSVKQDLKLKFTNKSTNKLISNVPFSVTVTDASGKTMTWVDDDKDGIIYKKGIAGGRYKVAVDKLADDKYKDYILPVGTESVTVKEEIVYEKVDVKNEIKTEAEVNAAAEDTKKNETEVESVPEDTVEWVESTVIANTYIEVAKSTIPNPLTLVSAAKFMRTANYTGTISADTLTLEVGGTSSLSVTYADSTGGNAVPVSVSWSSDNEAVATVDAGGVVKAVAAGETNVRYQADFTLYDVSGNATGTEKVSGECRISVKEPVKEITMTLDKTTVSLRPSGTDTIHAVVSNAQENKAVTASSSNTGVAAVAVTDKAVTVTAVAPGNAVITVKYAENGKEVTTTCDITVTANIAMTLNKTAVTVFMPETAEVTATISNALTQTPVTAESSDTNVARVSVKDKTVTITGSAAGSAVITVKYTENGAEVKATCAVTVKAHPKEDKNTKLLDTSGKQLYVLENEKYREAVYADYYTASQFFIRGEAKYTGWQTIDGKVYFFDATGKKVTGDQVIQGGMYSFDANGALITSDGVMGIDVSKWNGNIDWKAVKNSGVSYVIIRSGYRGSSKGALIVDSKFEANIKGATEAGLKVGIYFFTQAIDEVEAVEEASMVLEQVKGYKISYPIFLDVEASGGRADKIDKATRTAVCKAFCETIREAGYTAGIYANKTWLNNKIDTGQLNNYKIWLAQYSVTPNYSGRYEMWQYSKSGRISGISGDVDLNMSYLGY